MPCWPCKRRRRCDLVDHPQIVEHSHFGVLGRQLEVS
jgi:hypothetical protein